MSIDKNVFFYFNTYMPTLKLMNLNVELSKSFSVQNEVVGRYMERF